MEILIENNTNEKTLIKCWCDIEISIVSDWLYKQNNSHDANENWSWNCNCDGHKIKCNLIGVWKITDQMLDQIQWVYAYACCALNG